MVAEIIIRANQTLAFADIEAKRIISNSDSQALSIVTSARGFWNQLHIVHT